MEKKETGIQGENLAKTFLIENGYEILESNWRHKQYEVDLIAKKRNELIIVEVKTRRSNLFGEPEEFVNKAKQKNLFAAAQAFIELSGFDLEIRFDIISVLWSGEKYRINHIESAFRPQFR